jgi:hypothetical protein
MSRNTCALLLLVLSLAAGTISAHSQSSAQSQPQTQSPATPGSPLADAPAPADPESPTLRNLPANFLRDQGAIWTSPLRLTDKNAVGPVLLVGATALLISTDHQVMSDHFLDKSTNNHAETASTGLTGLLMAAPVAFFGVGSLKHDPHAQETGVMAGEALLDSVAVNEAVKIISRRERPTVDGARGKFFQSGVNFDSSFASNHSVIAWSSAAVIASEYNGPLTQICAYTLATGVTITRVASRNHFPSDVLVGSAVGWMIGRYVHHRHHRFDSY